jgi:aminoglycoside phosphotransferase (APT) family kinase protein
LDVRTIADELANGGRFQELTLGEATSGRNRVFRLFTPEGTRVLKVYGSPALQRRESHALQALGGVDGLPTPLDRKDDSDHPWVLFTDAGKWNLGSLPENTNLAFRAGEILRGVHDSKAQISNLVRGIDAEWVATDFYSVLRRLQRYRGRLRLPAEIFARASAVPPPPATEPMVSHARAAPKRFVVDDDGAVTLISWEWATLAPPEWDLSRVAWMLGTRVGDRSAEAFQKGYGRGLTGAELERWTVYHSAMLLLFRADDSSKSGTGADLDYLISEFHRSVAAA